MVTSESAGTVPPELSSPVVPAEAPLACTLPVEEMPDQMHAWQGVLAYAATRARTEDGALRVVFDPAVDIGDLARLVAAEQRCCAFFSFAITVDHRGVALEVRAPEGADAIVDALFDAAS